MHTVIDVKNLSKKYVIGHQKRERYTALRDVIAEKAKRITSKLRHPFSAKKNDSTEEEFWALKDVNFEIKQGDRVGIIGRNGAGKSTLLKILSRITEPTSGRIAIKGRVVSLLEVGTGFHPELTGRENIFLNGAILGMSKLEIKRKFDEIVDFSEVEKFLDTPVKRYSSGMYVRLAFAVAAHLEPEILILDEVLAVGDAAFQKKCFGRMEEVGKEGRTILFVSHNMGAVTQLCNSVIYLRDGQIIEQSKDLTATIKRYQSVEVNEQQIRWIAKDNSYQNDWFAPTSFYLCNQNGNLLESNSIGVNERINICIEGVCEKVDSATQVGVSVYSADGSQLFWTFTTDNEASWLEIQKGHNRLVVTFPEFLLNEGSYQIELGVALYHRQWICEPGKNSPSITLNILGGFIASRYWTQRRPGILAPCFSWQQRG